MVGLLNEAKEPLEVSRNKHLESVFISVFFANV